MEELVEVLDEIRIQLQELNKNLRDLILVKEDYEQATATATKDIIEMVQSRWADLEHTQCQLCQTRVERQASPDFELDQRGHRIGDGRAETAQPGRLL